MNTVFVFALSVCPRQGLQVEPQYRRDIMFGCRLKVIDFLAKWKLDRNFCQSIFFGSPFLPG